MMGYIKQATYRTVRPSEAHIETTLKDVEFECGHTRKYEPRYTPVGGELVWCPRCQEYRRTLGADTTEYYVRCTVCTYGRRYGEDYYAAQSAIRRHKHLAEITRITRKAS